MEDKTMENLNRRNYTSRIKAIRGAIDNGETVKVIASSFKLLNRARIEMAPFARAETIEGMTMVLTPKE
jgi:hypothetical protein